MIVLFTTVKLWETNIQIAIAITTVTNFIELFQVARNNLGMLATVAFAFAVPVHKKKHEINIEHGERDS